jgi:hypothetical protein
VVTNAKVIVLIASMELYINLAKTIANKFYFVNIDAQENVDSLVFDALKNVLTNVVNRFVKRIAENYALLV